MTGTHYVFTLRSLKQCLERAPNDWFANFEVPNDEGWDIAVIQRDDALFFVHRADVKHNDESNAPTARIILITQNGSPVSPVPVEARRVLLERIHGVATRISAPPLQLPLRLPPAWSAYHYENFIAFFACPHGANVPSLRWIAEIHPQRSADICFWELTRPEDTRDLGHYSPEYPLYNRIVGHWKSVLAYAAGRFAEQPERPTTLRLETAIDLEATTFGAVVQNRTYSSWLEHLTPKQREFLKAKTSVKLKGPAGSGKTLALELKALQELYKAREARRQIRILFATYSWAAAEQVDAALRRLDGTGDVREIEVYPLLEIARSGLPVDRGVGRGFELLGEDSLSGRRHQLRRISDIVDRLAKSDWLIHRRHASTGFRARVEAPEGSDERNALVWDLMVEFSSVLAANRILPGVNAERRYIALQRTSWMMPLEAEADQHFVYRIYSEYVASLKDEGLLSGDQLINDFLSYLETFMWNLRREEEGYDLIFVDELHLFSEEERVALHYLTRSATEYPKMFMALDPRQAPSEVYAEFPTGTVAQGESGRADRDLGDVPSVDLPTIHRFTPEILALIQHILRRYPALNLGPDWEMDIDSLRSAAEHGARPVLYQHPTRADEIASIVRRVGELSGQMRQTERIAIVLVDPLELTAYGKELEGRSALRLWIVQSRDDVERLRYAKKSAVLGAAEYLAGLQFDSVVIAGVPNKRTGVAHLGYQLRRLLTLLYLGISRATRHVEIHVNDESGGAPEILGGALAAGVIIRSSEVELKVPGDRD